MPDTAKLFNIEHVYTDYQELLKVVDAVTICTPNRFHAEMAIKALEAGKHVLCEKPMAMNAEECQAMIDAAKKSGALLSVGYHFRFTKDAAAAKKVSTIIEDANSSS